MVDWLVTTRGWRRLTQPRDTWRTHDTVNAIDAALDAMIQLFYLRRDGIAVDGTLFAQRQLDCADAVFAWLGKQLMANGKSFDGSLGIVLGRHRSSRIVCRFRPEAGKSQVL